MDGQQHAQNATVANLQQEVVLREDGRYVIYYSWPDDEAESSAPSESGHQPSPPPAQTPWAPDREPTDV